MLQQLVAGALGLVLPLGVLAQAEASSPNHAAVEVAQLRLPNASGFNTAFLHGAGASVDMLSLLQGYAMAEGAYLVDLFINGLQLHRTSVVFSRNPASSQVEPCFTPTLLRQAGVDMQKIEQQLQHSEMLYCLRLEALIPQATVQYDSASLRLHLNVPQAYMHTVARGYVDPSLWSDGVPVVFSNYNLYIGRGTGTSTNTSLNLNAGANWGGWRLRSNASLSKINGGATDFQSQNTYVQRDVTGLKSQLWAGDTYTTSQLFDSVRFRGVQLASDEGMLPDNERGYAPVIRGVAESNATIEVRQNGFLLYTETVAPGPFEITNLSPSGANGNLEITVIEADGRRRTSIQAFSNPPLMVREGRVKYDATLGQVRQQANASKHPMFVSASALYGWSSNVSLAGGLQASAGYQNIAAGVGLNTRVGAISLDIAHARSQQPTGTHAGESVRLLYGKYFEQTATNFSLSAQYSLGSGYRNLSDHVAARDVWASVEGGIARLNLSGARSQLSLYLNQQLGENNRYGNFYVSATDMRHWDTGRTRSISAGYSHAIGTVAFNAGYSHNRNTFAGIDGRSRNDNVLSLSASIPLGQPGQFTPNSYTSVNRRSAGTAVNTGVSGALPWDSDVHYSVAAGRDVQGNTSNSIFLTMATSLGTLNAGHSNASGTSSSSFQANGSVVVHAGGVNMGQAVGESFVLAQVDPPVTGVNVGSNQSVSTGRNGYAIVPYATPYRQNWVSMEAKGMGADVEINNNMLQVVPRRGAAVLASFKSTVGRRVQFELKLPDGHPVPFGTVLHGIDGENLGVADPRGRVFAMLEGEKDQGELIASWEGQQCRLPYKLPPKLKDENYQRMTLTCAEVSTFAQRRKGRGANVAQHTTVER